MNMWYTCQQVKTEKPNQNWHWWIEDGGSSTSFQLVYEELDDAASDERRFGRLDANLPMPCIIFRLGSSPSHQRWIARHPGTTTRAVIPFVASSFLLFLPSFSPFYIPWKMSINRLAASDFHLEPATWTYLDIFVSLFLSLPPSLSLFLFSSSLSLSLSLSLALSFFLVIFQRSILLMDCHF